MFCDYTILVTLYKVGKVVFRFLGTNWFSCRRQRKKHLLLRACAVVRTSKTKISRLLRAEMIQHSHPDPLKQNEAHVRRMAWGRSIFHLLLFVKMFRSSVSVAVIFLFANIHMISGECPKVRIIKQEQVLFEILAISS